MRFVARVVATVILGPFLLTSAFAEEAANPPANSTTSEATAPNATASSTGYLAPAVPMPPQAKTKTKAATGSGDTYPAADLFLGFSFVRFSTNSRKPRYNHQRDFQLAGLYRRGVGKHQPLV